MYKFLLRVRVSLCGMFLPFIEYEERKDGAMYFLFGQEKKFCIVFVRDRALASPQFDFSFSPSP